MASEDPETAVPLVEEHLSIDKRTVETGRVRVRTIVEEGTGYARADLYQENVDVTRVTIDRIVDAVPPVREEGDTLIVPVIEEVLVTEKRLLLREEIHLNRRRTTESVEHSVPLRTMRAVIERTDLSTQDPPRDSQGE